MDKKLLLGIIAVIVIVAIGFFSLKGSDNTTGAATEVPEENAGGTQETSADSSKFSEITEGMSKADVTALVGEPSEKQNSKTSKGNPIEYWYYEAGEDIWQIGISNDEVQVVRTY